MLNNEDALESGWMVLFLKLSVPESVPGREEQLGAGQSGHAGELSTVPSVRPGQGEALLLSSALRQQVRCQRPLRAQRARRIGRTQR